jgi:HEAT repeat protein
MPSNFSCPHCHTPLNLSQAGPGGGTAACPQCGVVEFTSGPSQAAPAEVPWWVTSPPVPLPGEAAPSDRPADEAPWWVTPPVSLPAAPPPPVAATPAPRAGRGWALAGVCLAVAVLLAAGIGLVFLCFPGPEPAASPLAQARSASPEAQPAAAAPAQPDKGAGPSESIPPPRADAPAPAGRPEAPEKVAGPVPEPPAPPERPKGAGRDEGERTETASSPTKPPDENPPELPEGAAPLVWRLASAKRIERLQGAALLGRYGGAAKAAAPTLAYTMRADPDTAVANEAAAALARIGRAGVPHLIEGLKDERAVVRQRAAAALAVIGPEGRSAAPALLDALKDKRPKVRAVAAHALGEVRGDPRQVAPALCKALGDASAEVRQKAMLALANLGGDAVPTLREALKGDDPKLRRDAALALAAMGIAAREAAGDLGLLVKDRDPQVRAAGAQALAGLGKDAQAAIPALLQVLRTENTLEVQKQVLGAILRIGSKDMPGLLKALEEINDVGRWATPYILKQFGPKARDAVPHLIKHLSDPDMGNRLSAAISLGEIGADASEAVPALVKAMQDPIPTVRLAAAMALVKVDPSRKAALEQKARQALDQTEQALQAAAERLRAAQSLLPEAADPNPVSTAPCRPVNRQALTDPAIQQQFDKIIQMFTLAASGRLGCDEEKSFGSPDRIPGWRKDIKDLLDRLGPEAVPALVRALNRMARYQVGFC